MAEPLAGGAHGTHLRRFIAHAIERPSELRTVDFATRAWWARSARYGPPRLAWVACPSNGAIPQWRR